MSGLDGKVILVTGASSGIGAATVKHFAAQGAKLVLVARNAEKLQEVGDQCRALGSSDVLIIAKDVSVLKNCSDIVNEAMEHFQTLDVLVNNAGVMFSEKLDKVTEEMMDKSFDLNVKTALHLTQLAVKHMENSSIKAIVNVSSIAGLRAYPGSIAYKISKAGMDQLTRCSALELAPKGIRVNSVNPGVIDTEFFVNSGMSAKASKTYVEEKSPKIHPLGRCGQAEEVAKAIAFLASMDASFICGQTLAVDGGRSVACPS